MINQLYNLTPQRNQNGNVHIHFPKIDTSIDIEQAFTSYNINFDQRILCFFRDGKQDFTKSKPSQKRVLAQVFSFEGALEHKIHYPEINKKFPEGKYNLAYWYSSFVENGISISFHSTIWQIGDFQSVYDFNMGQYGSYHPSR